MKKLTCLISSTLILLVNCYVIYSQQPDFIRGKIIDSKTSEPVPFAALHLKNSQVGIYSNAEGDFRILNNPEFQSDSLIVTCIGFTRISIPFNKLKKTEMNNIKLLRNIYTLKEIRINAKRNRRLLPSIIVARALNKIKENSPSIPFSYVSYYRDYQKDSINYLNLNEAIIQTLDKGFDCISDSTQYRLLDFKENTDFSRIKITPYYNLPETDHSDVGFKKIPNATVGDQYGNELYILMVHDAIRNFTKRSFSFVDTLSLNFIKNHWFSNPDGVRDGNTFLYKINFSAKRQITGDKIFAKGAIFIQPDDYSIHRFEYSVSYLNSDHKMKEIFSIEIEYGHEPAVDSRMCLKYISFNNSFTIPDSTDRNFFKLLRSEWMKEGGPYTRLWNRKGSNMTIIAFFNKKIDPVSAGNMENFKITLGKREGKITNIHVGGDTLYLTVRDDKFSDKEISSCKLNIKNLKDINGNIINNRRELEFRQFRELFVQEYNKPLTFQNSCFVKSMPLEQNCISISVNPERFWMNTPLKAEEKQLDSNNP